MNEQTYEYNVVMYPIALLGFITGSILEERVISISWLPWVIYGFGALLLLVALMRHRKIIVAHNEIVIKELIRGETRIRKSEVKYYRTTYEYRRTPFTTWYFTMHNDQEKVVSHDYMRNEKELTEAVNKWCSTLPYEPSA